MTLAREAQVGREAETGMAAQMNHSLGTADKIYDVSKKMHIACNFRETLKRIFTTNDISEDLDESVDYCQDDGIEDNDESSRCEDNYIDPMFEIEQHYKGQEPEKTFKPLEKQPRKKVWTTKDVSTLKLIAGEWMVQLMKRKGKVVRAELNSILQSHKLGPILLEHFTLDQVYNRVRFMVKGVYKF